MNSRTILNKSFSRNNMKAPTSLTKENFWNDLQANHPKAMKLFCDWIDDYKLRVGWNGLFNMNVYHPLNKSNTPKFHDLPIGLQIGIFFQFTTEVDYFNLFKMYENPISMEDFTEAIKKWFETAEGHVKG